MADIKEVEEPDAALPLPADLSDERLIHDQGLGRLRQGVRQPGARR